ncbi:CPBP family intramembrane glutamic endopeptidase [Abyssisolibacter fermentans]|uniref:CPBP family intramembrane glutamic endopeptidase n=1 Tax=Abyssisolibacter fermentans TaxID=1766203 RepID=UPI00083702AD|nr:CPBP family intramembrane glutamic endopeptidase [Abyssisolibacter fermentans]
MQIFELLISAIIQVVLFSSIPFTWWIVSGRKNSNFLYWLGLRKIIIKDKQKYIKSCVGMILLLAIAAFVIMPSFIDTSKNATSQYAGQGMSAFIPALIFSFIKTGLSEEIFFRGFLTKRLINKFGFRVGNSIQGLLFGLMHGIFFCSIAGVLGTITIIAFTGASGWLSGWINEKQSGGSIVSSWLLHGLGNIITSIAAMFNFI